MVASMHAHTPYQCICCLLVVGFKGHFLLYTDESVPSCIFKFFFFFFFFKLSYSLTPITPFMYTIICITTTLVGFFLFFYCTNIYLQLNRLKVQCPTITTMHITLATTTATVLNREFSLTY